MRIESVPLKSQGCARGTHKCTSWSSACWMLDSCVGEKVMKLKLCLAGMMIYLKRKVLSLFYVEALSQVKFQCHYYSHRHSNQDCFSSALNFTVIQHASAAQGAFVCTTWTTLQNQGRPCNMQRIWYRTFVTWKFTVPCCFDQTDLVRLHVKRRSSSLCESIKGYHSGEKPETYHPQR